MRKLSLVMLVVSSLLFACKKENVEPVQPTQDKSNVVIPTDTTTNPVDTTTNPVDTSTVDSIGYLVFSLHTVLTDNTPFSFTVYDENGNVLPFDSSSLSKSSTGSLYFAEEVTYSDCSKFSIIINEMTTNFINSSEAWIDFDLYHDAPPTYFMYDASSYKVNVNQTRNSGCITGYWTN